MPQKTYLVNKRNNQKFRLNGIIRSENAPSSSHQHLFSGRPMLFGSMDLPPKVDLRQDLTPVEDQSTLASCVANSLAGAYEYLLKKATGNVTDVSRLFIYYNARAKGSALTSGAIEDTGCVVTDAIEALKEFGVCLESIWKYDASRVNDRPSDEAFQQAKDHKINDAAQLDIDLQQMKSCLAQGFPFVFGLQLFSTFDNASQNGVVPMPDKSDASRESHGSHAMLAVGYSDQSQAFIVRNSWGDDWGDHGYCYIPYNYLANPQYSFDFWTIKTVMNSDFGTDHWSYEDNENYLDNKDTKVVDNDYDHAIETFDDDQGDTTNYDPYADPWSYPNNSQTDYTDNFNPDPNDQRYDNSYQDNVEYYDNQYQTIVDSTVNDQYDSTTDYAYTDYNYTNNNNQY